PLDLVPLPVTSNYSSDVDVRAEKIKELHEQVRGKIKKQNQKYAKQANRADLLNASAVQSSAADGLVVADGLLLAAEKALCFILALNTESSQVSKYVILCGYT
ncbi:hypothetical protein Tco_0372794, partial [Tanacetum coccineum]